jgi:hypothetical protein
MFLLWYRKFNSTREIEREVERNGLISGAWLILG